jgi:hypothetical protein
MSEEIVQGDNKYMVFKRSEFYEMMGRLALPPYNGQTSTGRKERAGAHWDCAPIAANIQEVAERTCVPDAVVIRRQDVFAPPALDAYANAIATAVEVMKVSMGFEDQAALLMGVADYFSDQAAKAWQERRKLPD